MIKKILVAFIAFFVCNAHAATYLDTENRLWFSADVVKNAIVDHVPDNKQQTVADLYQDLMEQETGKISIDSLFKVCRKAGFNTYKYDGFTQCRTFIQQMLTDAEVAQNVDLNGFCPGLDEKGNNPNKLRSITGETRIGDFCSSTNIYMGEVIFKPGYNCSCMAAVCNPGFEFQRGACVTKVADGNGNCLREAHKKTSENNYLEKCKSFCEKRYAGKACKYTSVVMSHSTGQCICNPNSDEVDAAYESMRRAEERLEQKKINNLKYYKVCDDDKGKTGGVEVCVEGVFNWVNVGRLQAVGLAQEYARVRYKDTIYCDTVNTDTRGNDDYVKCASTKSKRYYEFQFDDVKESVDSDIQAGVVLGICKIHNLESNILYGAFGLGYTVQNIFNRTGDMGCRAACNSELTKSANHMGLTARSDNGFCALANRSMTAEEAKSKLAKIDGIDNYIFFHGIQIQGSQNVVSQLRKYIESTGKTVRTFDCNKNVGEIKNSLLVGDDDVLRCTLNGQPIDFVFEDFSESWVYTQEVGESKVQCIVSGGRFSGQECYGLTQKQCIDANAKFLKQNPGASGFRWDGKECVSIDANEAQFYDGAIQVATGAVAVVDCVFGTKLGCVLVVVESAGLATEMTTGVAIENRAGKFLAVSTRCHARNCAINTIKNAGEVLSVMGALDETSLNSVDTELSRLVGYLEPEDLSGVSDGDWESIVTQLGGDPNDISGTALVTLNKIGLGLQFASIGISGLRLTALAIGKLAGKGSRVGRTTTAVARALDTSGDAARAANNITDAGRVADNASDVARTANVAPVSPSSADELATVGVREITDSRGRTLYQDMRNNNRFMSHNDVLQRIDELPSSGTSSLVNTTPVSSSADELATVGVREITDSRGRTLYQDMRNNNRFMSHNDVLQRIDELPSRANATVATNVATDASRATNNTTDVSRAAITPTNTSYVARTANTTTDATRATTNVATDGARTTNAATDASRTTNTATDAARAGNYTSDAGRATNATADAARVRTSVSDAVRHGSINISKADDDIIQSAIAKKRAGTLTKKEHAQAIRTMNKYFDENAARQFAEQMRENLLNAFYVHAEEFDEVLEDGQKYAEFIVKHLGPKYGVSGLQVRIRSLPAAYAMYADGVLYLNRNLGDIKAEKLISLVTHEFAHAIDDLAPQNGVIGRTLNKYGDVDALYVKPGELFDGGQDMYKLIPTERSAHLVGDIVSGTSNYGDEITNSIIEEIIQRFDE